MLMASWHLAPCLQVLLEQINAAAPRRSKRSDGTLGDAAHRQRKSDHNPDGDDRSVNALDVTHDPAGGMDCERLWRELIESRDERINYLIFRRRIWMRSTGRVSTYGGANAHNSHLHVSVRHEPRFEDDRSPWRLPMFGVTRPAATAPAPAVPLPLMEDDQMYARNPENGAIYAFTLTSFQHLSGPQWAARQQEGARCVDVHPWVLALWASTRQQVHVPG